MANTGKPLFKVPVLIASGTGTVHAAGGLSERAVGHFTLLPRAAGRARWNAEKA
jgi:hypothetical protein